MTTDPEFDLDLILNVLMQKQSMWMYMYRSDRKLVNIALATRAIPNEDNFITISAHSHTLEDFNYRSRLKILAPGVFDRNDLSHFMESLWKKINEFKECRYCQTPFVNEQCRFCFNCAAYAFVKNKEKCIICLEEEHPIKFRCVACVESRVCLKCANNTEWKNVCPQCKDPIQFLGKRTRSEPEDLTDLEED